MQVNCPVGDSLRSVAGWFVVVLLLLLRKANRVKEAWTLLIPLVVVYLALAVAERQLNAYLTLPLPTQFRRQHTSTKQQHPTSGGFWGLLSP